jgi:hypothetical protein
MPVMAASSTLTPLLFPAGLRHFAGTIIMTRLMLAFAHRSTAWSLSAL